MIVVLYFVSIKFIHANNQNIYHYSANNPESGVVNISIDISPPVVYIGHAGRGANLCKYDDIFYCINSIPFSFSVPKSSLKCNLSWEKNGRQYKIIRLEDMVSLGGKFSVYVIEGRKSGKIDALYYYSDSNGLIGFYLFEDNSFSSLYIINGNKGFPIISSN